MINQQELAQLYQQACEIELQAFKPGNVSVYADGHDMTVADFRVSAQVSAAPLCNPAFSLGEKIYHAIKETRQAVNCNTNLGIVLLCAPLIQAIELINQSQTSTLQDAIRHILEATTVSDADWAFKAIALAAPGGLGEPKEHDVHKPASVTLTQAMQLAADKDRIALQYATGYKDIFDFAVLRYNSRLSQWRDLNWAAAFLFTELLSQFPDSHIERKYGKQYTEWIAARMQQFLQDFGGATDPKQSLQALYCLDTEFKSKGVNPGTTADMTVATLLAVFIEERIKTNKH